MANRTLAELATEVMRLPGWLEAQEDPDSQDAAHILRVYSDLYADWTVREITYWDEDAIPQEVFQHIVRIVADSVAPAFGDTAPMEVDGETGQKVSMGKKGWNGLRRVIERKSSKMPTLTTYY